MKSKQTIKKGRLTLTLDPAQVFPDDPGNGTPAVVSCGNYSSTWHAAVDQSELLGHRDALPLTDAEVAWLDSLSDKVEEVFASA